MRKKTYESDNSKIIVMHLRDSKGIYGAERVILTLGKHLNKERFAFKLLCMKNADNRHTKLVEQTRKFKLEILSAEVRRRFDIRAIKKIRRVFLENGVDILHSHDFKSDFYALIASMGLGIKRVITAHGSTRDSLLKRLYLFFTEHFTYRFAHRIIAVSKNVSSQLKNQGTSPKKIKVIQNGIDFSLIENEQTDKNDLADLTKGRVVFGVVGRLFPDKGHRFFLESFSKIITDQTDALGLIVGDGPLQSELEERIKNLGLSNHVFLCGARADMKNVYDMIDFLVIPSLREGLPYVLLEAMAYRVPVLATAVGDIPLLIEDRVTGHLIQPGESAALEARLRELLSNQADARRMAERAQKVVISRFSEKRMVAETQALYEEIFYHDN